MTSATILGTGSYLPEKPIHNEDLERYFGQRFGRIYRILGPKTGQFACELSTGKLHNDESDTHMAYGAAKRAVENTVLKSSDLDLMILSKVIPDYTLPVTFFFVQEMLNIPSCAALEHTRRLFRDGSGSFFVANDFRGA